MAFFQCAVERDGTQCLLISLLECDEAIAYVIPCFAVITVDVRRIRYQAFQDDGTIKILDGFIRDDPDLNTRHFPGQIAIEQNSSNACHVQASDLEKNGIDITKLSIVEGKAIFIWKWQWVDNDDESEDEPERTPITVIPETPPTVSDKESDHEDELEEEAVTEVVHTVTFKCIGCTRDAKYQKVLEHIIELRTAGTNIDNIDCRIMPEPDNPADAKAIAFQCRVDSQWQTIGYIVKEALDEVHQALHHQKIIDVRLKWVKFIIYWQTPAWYAGIDITRIGEWPRLIVLAQSAKV